nr:hypothetical protein MACL_00001783 [Theileria orientalis]
MFLYHIKYRLITLLSCTLICYCTHGILTNNYTLGFLNTKCGLSIEERGFLNKSSDNYRKTVNNKLTNRRRVKYFPVQAKSEEVDSGTKYIDNYLKSGKGNLFKTQASNYKDETSGLTNLGKSQSWSEIVYDELLKNRQRLAKAEGRRDLAYKIEDDFEVKRDPFEYRLTPEGRLKLEDRIENLRRAAHSSPVQYKEKTPILWIVRSSHGNYCELLKKDEERIKSLVDRVRRHFPKSELQVLVMKLNVKMPLCEIMVEGTMPDLVRILHARGGTLQFYVVPRFWSRCEIIEKDPRLEALYGKATAPGLFPQWDESGMFEEIADCVDTRPDYALEFRSPSAWHVLPMMPEFDRFVMKTYLDKVHWPTRLRVQRAFENGLEDYRVFIEHQYERLQRYTRNVTNLTHELSGNDDPNNLLDLWLSNPADFN